MTLDPNHNLSDFAFERIEAEITASKLDERNGNLLMRSNLLVVDRLVAVEGSSVEVERDSGPSEVIEVCDNDCRARECGLRFDWWLTWRRRML